MSRFTTSSSPHNRRERRKQRRQAWNAAHPYVSAMPFLALTALMMAVIIAIPLCTLCYSASLEGRYFSFFSREEIYDEAVVQAEEIASEILDTDYSFNADVSVHLMLAPKDRIEELPQVTESILEVIPEIDRLYTLAVDGVFVGAADNAAAIDDALTAVKDKYTTPETRSAQFENQISVRCQYYPASTPRLAAAELTETVPSQQALKALDREFIRKNLSPGGCADLLAITYFLYFCRDKNHKMCYNR